MKKLLSMVLVFALVMAMSVTGMVVSSAEDTNPSDDAYVYFSDATDGRKSGFAYDCEDFTIDPTKLDLYDVELWIYIGAAKEGVKPCYDFLISLFTEGHYDASVGNNYTEKWALRYEWADAKVQKNVLNEGWNQVKIKLSEFTLGTAGNPNLTTPAYNAFQGSGKIVAMTLHENSDAGDASVYGTVNIGVSSFVITKGEDTFNVIDPEKEKTDADIINTLTTNTREGAVKVSSIDALEGDTNTGNNDDNKDDNDDNKDNNDNSDKNDQNTDVTNQIFVNSGKEASLVKGPGSWAAGQGNISGTDAYTINQADQTVTEYKNADNSPIMSAKQDWEGYFWVYIDNPATVGDFYWEIASSGNCTGACVRYIVNSSHGKKLEQGWNKVTFKLHNSAGLSNAIDAPAKSFSTDYAYYLGSNMTGNVDWAKINYVRIIFGKGQASGTIKINGFTLYDPKTAGNDGGNAGNGTTGGTSTGDVTPVVSIALATLASALIAAAVFVAIKKRTER